MAKRRKRGFSSNHAGRPATDSKAHRRIALMHSHGPDDNLDTRELLSDIRAFDAAAHLMGVVTTCDLALCRRHRKCKFDYAHPILPPADEEARHHMEKSGLPLCLAQHAQAYMKLLDVGVAMDTYPPKRRR